jgi:hypothetical protein
MGLLQRKRLRGKQEKSLVNFFFYNEIPPGNLFKFTESVYGSKNALIFSSKPVQMIVFLNYYHKNNNIQFPSFSLGCQFLGGNILRSLCYSSPEEKQREDCCDYIRGSLVTSSKGNLLQCMHIPS